MDRHKKGRNEFKAAGQPFRRSATKALYPNIMKDHPSSHNIPRVLLLVWWWQHSRKIVHKTLHLNRRRCCCFVTVQEHLCHGSSSTGFRHRHRRRRRRRGGGGGDGIARLVTHRSVAPLVTHPSAVGRSPLSCHSRMIMMIKIMRIVRVSSLARQGTCVVVNLRVSFGQWRVLRKNGFFLCVIGGIIICLLRPSQCATMSMSLVMIIICVD